MQWTDTAIILSCRKHGENNAVARLLSRHHGVYGGIVRATHSKAARGILHPSNIVSAIWQARLSEQLGSFRLELLEANAAYIMADQARLNTLMSACAIIESALPERHPYPKLYEIFKDFLHTLRDEPDWPEAYVKLELNILAESGFGLDLSTCAATGTTEDLIYVSPKSGRAVCREAGEPYREKLLPLPGFLTIVLPLGESGQDQAASAGRAVRGNPIEHEVTFHDRARELRKSSTEAEQKLWLHLSNRRLKNYKFRRQHPIGNRYIADFICLERKVIIELDGSQHAEQQEYDTKRSKFLKIEGYTIIRFWNHEVIENINAILEQIIICLQNPLTLRAAPQNGACSQPLSPKGRALNILAGLRLTGYFLDHWLLAPHRHKLPAARGRLIQLLNEERIIA